MICPVRYFIFTGGSFVNTSKTVRALSESAMMIALGTVLSIFKIVELPYGGSVTVASMLPMIILAYRQGLGWGLGSGVVYAALQQLLGLNNLSYVTGWQSIVAVICLDYIAAFAVVGLGGIFRRVSPTQRTAMISGAALVSLLRYLFHVIAGATVWVGLSIPDSAALAYSLGYNATYMIPETIILISTAYYLGGVIDFSLNTPTRVAYAARGKGSSSSTLSGLIFLLGVIVDVWLIAPYLQDAESGKFTFAPLADANWLAVSLVTALSAVTGILILVIGKKKKN